MLERKLTEMFINLVIHVYCLGCCIWLCCYGSSIERGASIYPQHCQADQESWLQRSPHPEIHLEGRSLRPRHPFLWQDEDHGCEGYREGRCGVPVQSAELQTYCKSGSFHSREPHLSRMCRGGKSSESVRGLYFLEKFPPPVELRLNSVCLLLWSLIIKNISLSLYKH